MAGPITVTMRGSMYAVTSSPMSFATAADTLDGFSTTVLPAAMAPASGTIVSITAAKHESQQRESGRAMQRVPQAARRGHSR